MKVASLLLALAVSSSLLAEKPNVLFFAIDDQNDWIGAFGGHPLAKTPHLDTLAEIDGVGPARVQRYGAAVLDSLRAAMLSHGVEDA